MVVIIMKTLLDKHPRNHMGDTPLHLAVRNGHYDITKYIMETLLDKHPRNHIGDSPLDLAAKEGNLEIVKLYFQEADEKIQQMIIMVLHHCTLQH